MSCRGHRHRALIVRGFANETCRWQGSGHRLRAARSLADASGPRKAEETKLAQGMAVGADGRVKPSWHGNGPLDRWTGQTKLADGMVRWTDGKVKRKLAAGMVRWTDGRVKPS